MKIEEYQKLTEETTLYPKIGHNVIYPILGLIGELGEFCNKLKKVFRDNNGVMSDEFLEFAKKEIGDQYWYINRISTELGFNLEEIAQENISKLQSRKARGVIQGSGDNR